MAGWKKDKQLLIVNLRKKKKKIENLMVLVKNLNLIIEKMER